MCTEYIYTLHAICILIATPVGGGLEGPFDKCLISFCLILEIKTLKLTNTKKSVYLLCDQKHIDKETNVKNPNVSSYLQFLKFMCVEDSFLQIHVAYHSSN